MAVTPQTDIYLLKCPLQLSNKHQINFANKDAQFNYFNSLPKIGIDDGSYQRKDGVIRYPAHIDTIQEYNYCMYRNDNYSNKWFYAFITDKQYENDDMTYITIKTDVFQTWQFDLIWKQSFVEREHVLNDTIGLHTLPENVEHGEYIVESIEKLTELENMSYIIQVTEWTTEGASKPLATNFGGVYSAGRCLYL